MAAFDENEIQKCVDALAIRVREIQQTILRFLDKLNTMQDEAEFTALLENYTVIVSQIKELIRDSVLRDDTGRRLKRLAILPLELSMNVDPILLNMTEGRMPYFSHENAPVCLGVKLDDKIYNADRSIWEAQFQKVTKNPEQFNKQLGHFFTVCSAALDAVTSGKSAPLTGVSGGEREGVTEPTYDRKDTKELVLAVECGIGFDVKSGGVVNSAQVAQPQIQQQQQASHHPGYAPQTPQMVSHSQVPGGAMGQGFPQGAQPPPQDVRYAYGPPSTTQPQVYQQQYVQGGSMMQPGPGGPQQPQMRGMMAYPPR